jgi:hypothetical protein
MSFYNSGAPVHGEFSSADASALTEENGRFSIYGAGSTSAVTLGSTDVVCITDLHVMVGSSALTVTVYDGANNAAGGGEVVVSGEYPANGGAVLALRTPHVCQAGTYPKVITSGAGSVKVQFHGHVVRKES